MVNKYEMYSWGTKAMGLSFMRRMLRVLKKTITNAEVLTAAGKITHQNHREQTIEVYGTNQ